MKKINNFAIIIFGILAIGIIPVCMWGSSIFNQELVRWQEARFVQNIDGLRSMKTGDDLILVGSLPVDMGATREGMAIYEEWTLKLAVGEARKKWHLTDEHKPTFEITLDGETVSILSAGATLYNTQSTMIQYDERLEGLKPGTEVTIFGKLSSSEGSPAVKAEGICSGNKAVCMNEFARPSWVLISIAIVLALSGLGMIWFGMKKLRS